ncbi:MAG: hypothetical protein B0A82_00670 [Alkalinema sp. CACIAM 70d]|nr:MAG: hypothetical protein B0A82_00670 [Alkalinema sp. CACIAM 70d]
MGLMNSNSQPGFQPIAGSPLFPSAIVQCLTASLAISSLVLGTCIPAKSDPATDLATRQPTEQSTDQETPKGITKGSTKALNPDNATYQDSQNSTIAALQPDLTPFNVKQLNQGLCESSVPGVSDRIDFQSNLSLPSLWLARDQFAAQAKFGSKLLEGWLACPQNAIAQPKVSVIINEQLWSLLDYLERYQFLNQFGTAAQQEGFNLRLFSRQGHMLAAYTCVVPGQTEPVNGGQRPCAMQLDALGRGSVRGRSTGLFGSIPTTGGIAQP